MADVDAKQAGYAVQPPVAISVEKVATLASFEHGEVVLIPGPLPSKMRYEVLSSEVSLCGHSHLVSLTLGLPHRN
jgi:hypothetical protein